MAFDVECLDVAWGSTKDKKAKTVKKFSCINEVNHVFPETAIAFSMIAI